MRPGVAPAIAPKAAPGQAVNEQGEGKPAGRSRRDRRARARFTSRPAGSPSTTEERSGHHQPACGFLDGPGNRQLDGRHLRLAAGRSGAGSGGGADHAARRRDGPDSCPACGVRARRASCRLHAATADYRGGKRRPATRRFCSAKMDRRCAWMRSSGFTLTTATGGHLAAPTGSMDFNEHNQPRHGHLEGGVQMDSASGRRPERQIAWDVAYGGARIHARRASCATRTWSGAWRCTARSSQRPRIRTGRAVALRVSRTWRSPVADVEFRDAGHGHLEPASIHGTAAWW